MQSFSTSPNTDQAFIDFFFSLFVHTCGSIALNSQKEPLWRRDSAPTEPPPSITSSPATPHPPLSAAATTGRWAGGQAVHEGMVRGWAMFPRNPQQVRGVESHWTASVIYIWPPSPTLVKNKEKFQCWHLRRGWGRMNSGSIPKLGRSPGGGYGSLLQYACLENPMDRGAWCATVPGLQRIGYVWVT